VTDVAHKWGAEAVDEELDRLISRRASQDRRPDPDEQHELWKMGVAAYDAARIEENRQAWREHHERQAACLRAMPCLLKRSSRSAARQRR